MALIAASAPADTEGTDQLRAMGGDGGREEGARALEAAAAAAPAADRSVPADRLESISAENDDQTR